MTDPFPFRRVQRKDYLQCHDYFMASAVLSSKRCKDPAPQEGAIIVDEGNRIVASGYNKLLSGCEGIQFEDETLDPIMHAEADAILNKNCADLKNTRLYTTLYPCSDCTKLIIESGISKVFYMRGKPINTDLENCDYRASTRMFEKAGIECEKYELQQTEIVIKLRPA